MDKITHKVHCEQWTAIINECLASGMQYMKKWTGRTRTSPLRSAMPMPTGISHTWRLIDTINRVKASALVYSIVETAKANGLNLFRYLEFLLAEMMEHEEDTDYGFLDDLLSWSESIPDICKIQSKK